MNKLVYIYVKNEFEIVYVLLTLLIKRLAVAMANKTVGRQRGNEFDARPDVVALLVTACW
jgi:hypothetical protein